MSIIEIGLRFIISLPGRHGLILVAEGLISSVLFDIQVGLVA